MSHRQTYRGEWVFSSMLAEQAGAMTDEVAVITDRGTTSYGALGEIAQRVAGGLSELGIGAGDAVATMLDPSEDYLGAWFGASWAGAIDVPVNTGFKGLMLEHVLRQSGACALVLDGRWLDRLADIDTSGLRHLVIVGEYDGDQARRLAPGAAVHPFAQLRDASPAGGPAPRQESDPLYIMFTSGTTGPSKGALLSNRAALYNAQSWIDVARITSEDTSYSLYPLYHVTARSALVTSALWAGARTVLRGGFSARSFWDDIRATGATYFCYMGVVIQLLFDQPPRDDDADNPLRVGFGSSAPPGIVSDFEKRFGTLLMEVYGSTELGPASAPSLDRIVRGTMGRPLPQLQIEIHDESDRPRAPGEPGEIVVRPNVPNAIFTEYVGAPVETVAAFRNLWFHTGDRGYLTPDGDLVFVDRIKDAIRRRGENISSFEVERAVQAHPSIAQCAAYGVPSGLTEEEVMVAVVLADGCEFGAASFFDHCIKMLPRFAVPRYVRVVDEIPRTPSERIMKYGLRDEGVTADTLDRDALGIVVPRD